MKAYKCILPFVVLFLVHGASATFGLWNSEKIKGLIKHKINRLYIPFITPRYPLFGRDHQIFRYHFFKPALAKSIFVNNPVNVQYSTDGVVYGSSANDMQNIGLSYINELGQYESTQDNHNEPAGDQFSGEITEEHKNEYVYPTINNDNIQYDDASNGGVAEEYESDYAYPDDSIVNIQIDGQNRDEIAEEYESSKPRPNNDSNIDNKDELEGVEGNIETSVNPESGIEVVENIGEYSDYDTDVVDADDSVIIGEKNISGADTKPITEDVDESGFTYTEPASETAEVNSNENNYSRAKNDLVYDGIIDNYGKPNNSETDIYSDTGSAKGYGSSSTETETTADNGINNPVNSNIDYFPLIDVRIGGNDED